MLLLHAPGRFVLRRNTLTLHHSEPMDLNAAFREVSQLVEAYATKHTLPGTEAAPDS